MARLSKGEFTEKKGFSVVAPMRTTSPSSTAGSRASCWDLLNRCTSSMKRMVPRPCSPSSRRASSMAPRTSATPAFTADSGTKVLAVVAATTWARVVFPVPAGPHKMAEVRRSCFDEDPERGVGRHQMALAHDVVEGAGSQTRRQRGALAQAVGGRLGEEVGPTRGRVGAGSGSPCRCPRSARRRAQSPAGVIRRPRSRSARSARALGAPVMGSVPDWVFG